MYKIESVNSMDQVFIGYYMESDINVMQIELFWDHVFKITKLA